MCLFIIQPPAIVMLLSVVKEADIESIKADYPCNSLEQCYKMLLTWKQRYAQNATYQALGWALLTEARNVYPEIVSSCVH